MKYCNKLFRTRRPYDVEGTDDLFVQAMRENVQWQYDHCADYRRILDEAGFAPGDIAQMDDLVRLPFLPTLYLKHHRLISVPERELFIKATSSGTSGSFSEIGFDLPSLLRGLHMVITVGKYHRLWSLRPVHYLIFGYQPALDNRTAISKTALGFTFFAPALSRTYALRHQKDGGYALNMEGMRAAFLKYERSSAPIRTIGFPAYTYFLLKEMKEAGLRLKMPRGSLVTLGGGWKQFYAQKVEKADFYALVEEVLGIPEDHVMEFFGAVEHPILHTDCRCHHFHVPAYARVIIRDPDTMEPLPAGELGLVNLLTPMVKSVPLASIMTDDLGRLTEGPCPCGESSPRLEIIGRVGVRDIVTCAAGAEELLGGGKET